MSTYWDIHCRTCDEAAGFYVNHGEEHLLALLRHMGAWQHLSRADLGNVEMRLSGDENGALTNWPAFASKHVLHDVTLRSEYGDYFDECSVRVKCPTCGRPEPRCRLPRGHDGDHSVTPVKPQPATK